MSLHSHLPFDATVRATVATAVHAALGAATIPITVLAVIEAEAGCAQGAKRVQRTSGCTNITKLIDPGLSVIVTGYQ